MVLTDKLKAIADSIRYAEKKVYGGEGSGSMTLAQMPSKIKQIADYEPLPTFETEYANILMATGSPRYESGLIKMYADRVSDMYDADDNELDEGIIKNGSVDIEQLSIRAQASEFGDATAADVAEGKTFTSAAGLKMAGTYSENAFPYGGKNATKVAEYDETFTLADTTFPVGTFTSTTATSIKATVSNRFTSPTIAIGDKDVVVIQTVMVVPEYSGGDGKAQEIAYINRYTTHISKRRTSANATKNTRQSTSLSIAELRYGNTSAVDTIGNASYGLYATPQAATVASATAASTTVRASSPILYARVSTSYSKKENMQKITDCTWFWHVDVYLVDGQSTVGSYNVNEVCDQLMSIPKPFSVTEE